MRKGYNDYGIIIDDGKFVGISLGYDFTAEHEWGIDGMKRLFGIPEGSSKNMGVECRSITKCPDTLVFLEKTHKKRKCAVLFTGYKYATKPEDLTKIPSEIEDYVRSIEYNLEWNTKHPNEEVKDPIVTAWDGDTFGVAVMGTHESEWLKELYQAFQDKNVTITSINLAGKNPFSRGSLSLLIKDRLPKEAIDYMYLADKEHYDMEDYEKKIGMKKVIEKYGNKNGYQGDKYFCACSPKWIDFINEEKREAQKKKYNTKFDIMYWVNYSDSDNNYGWYTVEEIREWMTTKKKLVEIRKA